jgi:hypothetical protein
VVAELRLDGALHLCTPQKDTSPRSGLCKSITRLCSLSSAASILGSARRQMHTQKSKDTATRNVAQGSGLTLPTVPVVKTTSLNSLTIWPGPNSPREPPDLPEGQVLRKTSSVRTLCLAARGVRMRAGRWDAATHECSLASSVNLPITSPEASMVALSSRHLASSLTRMWLAEADRAEAVPTRAAERASSARHITARFKRVRVRLSTEHNPRRGSQGTLIARANVTSTWRRSTRAQQEDKQAGRRSPVASATSGVRERVLDAHLRGRAR